MEKNELTKVEREERALVQAAREGEGPALEALFNRYQPLVRRLWLRMAIRDIDREDWQQEAFLVLHRAVGTYRPEQPTRFCWYLHHLLENRLRDLYRRKVSTKRIPAQLIQPLSVDNDLTTLPAPTPSPEEEVLIRERRRLFLLACSATERQVIILASQGLTTEETARLLGCSATRVKNARHRARAKLRWLLS